MMSFEVITAAGGVVWKDQSRNELLVIHRDKYDDWTLPKGKVKKGEDWTHAAIREVNEETGFDIELSDFAGCVCYQVHNVPKVVLFWNMILKGKQEFKTNKEVDQVLWLDLENAVEKLHYVGEKQLLRAQKS